MVGLAVAQDTLRFMAYNLLFYGSTPGFCDLACKDEQLRIILNAIKPHVLGVNEIAPDPLLMRRLLDSVLNIEGVSYWRSSYYANPSRSNIVSALFYDSRRLGWLKQELVTTQNNLRDVYAYHLFYKEREPQADTLFLVVIVSHLKAGDTPADAEARAEAAEAIRRYIQELPENRRLFVIEMGDHNFYTAAEEGYQSLVQALVDPAPAGDWSGNPLYAYFHTQSTRVSQLPDQGMGGGLNDRFDFILFSPACTLSSSRMRYVPGSFRAVGQDGQRFGSSINSSPLPAGYDPSLINALYTMSDHLPVIADFALSASPALSLSDKKTMSFPFSYSVQSHTLSLWTRREVWIQIWDGLGRQWVEEYIPNQSQRTYTLPPGLYLLCEREQSTCLHFLLLP